MTGITVRPSGRSLGADIEGVDLSQPIDDATFGQILDAWAEHLVLRCRGQKLTDDQLAEFSARFGALDNAPIRASGTPEHERRRDIAVISNIVEGDKPVGSLGNSELVWHQDMSYKDLPPKASILYGVETPATLLRPRGFSGAGCPDRRRIAACREAARDHHLSPDGDVPDGTAKRSDRGRR